MAGLVRFPGIEKIEVKPRCTSGVPRRALDIVLSEGGCSLGNATGTRAFVMSASFANQTLAQNRALHEAGPIQA